MDSAAKESILPDRLSERLGSLILKDEQRLAVEALRSGMMFLRYYRLASVNLSSTKAWLSRRISLPSLLLFLFGVSSMINYSPNDFGLKAVAFQKKPELMKDIAANKFQVIFAWTL